MSRMEESPGQARSRAPTPRVSDELANLGKLLVFPGIRLEMLEAGNGKVQDGISACFSSSRRVGGPEGDLEDPGGGRRGSSKDKMTNGGDHFSEGNGARLKTNGSLNNSSRERNSCSSSGEARLEMESESTVSFHAIDQSSVERRSTTMVERRATTMVVDNMSNIGLKIVSKDFEPSSPNLVGHGQSIEVPSISGEVN